MFAFTFGQEKHARGLLRASLPPALVARLDWRSLRREPADFVDPRLRWRHSDLLFSVRARGAGAKGANPEKVLVYLLLEHQSQPDPLMVYRLLRYLVRAWDEHLKAHRGARKLPVIVPLLIYHGKPAWGPVRSFHDVLAVPAALLGEVAVHVPQFRPRLVDLRHEDHPDADRLMDHLVSDFGKIALWALTRAGEDAGLVEEMQALFGGALAQVLRHNDAQGAITALWRYLLATHEVLDRDKLRRLVVERMDPAAGENLMNTVYDQLVEQGRKQGWSEGRSDGQAALLLEQLAAKFGVVPARATARVKAATSAELTTWARRVLTATTLAETLGPDRGRAARPARRR